MRLAVIAEFNATAVAASRQGILKAVEIGLGERGAETAIAIDDDVIILGRTRNNRGGSQVRTRGCSVRLMELWIIWQMFKSEPTGRFADA